MNRSEMNKDLVFYSKAEFRTFNTEMTPSIVSEVEVYCNNK